MIDLGQTDRYMADPLWDWGGYSRDLYTNEVGRVYIRRGKKVLLFNTPEEADQYLAAEQAASEALEKAQKTSRRARKRIKEKIYPLVDSIDLIEIKNLAVVFDVPYNLPRTFNDADYFELMRIAELLKQKQDEEDMEILLLAQI